MYTDVNDYIIGLNYSLSYSQMKGCLLPGAVSLLHNKWLYHGYFFTVSDSPVAVVILVGVYLINMHTSVEYRFFSASISASITGSLP